MDYTVILIEVTSGDLPSLYRWFVNAADPETASELAAGQWEAENPDRQVCSGMVFDGTIKEVWKSSNNEANMKHMLVTVRGDEPNDHLEDFIEAMQERGFEQSGSTITEQDIGFDMPSGMSPVQARSHVLAVCEELGWPEMESEGWPEMESETA